MIIIRQKAFSDNPEPEQREFNSKAQKLLRDKHLASYVKPGYSVPKSKVREYLNDPERSIEAVKTKKDMVNWGINVKAGHSGGLAGARSTHLDNTGVSKSNKFYDHRESNVKKNKDTMKFVRSVIDQNKK